MRYFSWILGVFLLCFGWGIGEKTVEARERVNLDGTWNFTTVPIDGKAAQSGKIQVPGSWDAQGYGEPTAKIKSNFVGVGRYERTLDVPKAWNPATENLVLVLEGISRYAKVFLNDQPVGDEAIGVIGAFSWVLNDAVTPGQHVRLRIDVDSEQRWEIDAMLGAAQLNDYMEIAWGGLWGHVYLETQPKVGLDDVLVRTKIAPPTVFCEPTFRGTVPADAEVRTEFFDLAGEKIAEKSWPVAEFLGKKSGEFPGVELSAAQLWTPDTPNLYRTTVSLVQSGRTLDALSIRFGIRELKIDGNRFLLNGKRFFLRGYGDDHIYPMEFSMSTDKEMYLRRLRMIKAFGFNHVRLHSTIMPHEYYEACDEVGIMPNAEFVIGYPWQMPNKAFWRQRVPAGADYHPALQKYLERWTQVVREYRNHPCIFSWVLGNELNMDSEPFVGEFIYRDAMEIVRRLDPDRPYIDLDGYWRNRIAEADFQTDTADYYSALFDEWSNPILNGHKFDLAALSKPVISHESGNYITFCRPDQIALFDASPFIPFWMADGQKQLDTLGLASEAESWARASEELYYLLHKYNLETLRKNETLSGYHWWLIQDYWTTSNGLVDFFFRPKSLSFERVREINNDVVLLQNGLEITYSAGQTMDLRFLVSQFASEDLTGTVRVRVRADDQEIGMLDVPKKTWKQGTLLDVGALQGKLPPVETVTRIAIEIVLETETQTYTNHWTSWLFPEKIQPSSPRVYASTNVRDALPETWTLPTIESLTEYPTDAIYVVDLPNEKLRKAMENGAKVILLDRHSLLLDSIGINYQQTWWKAGDSESQNHTGSYVYDHPMVRDFAPQRWADVGWSRLFDGSCKFKVQKDNPVEVLVRALPSLVLVQDTPVVYQVRVGKGTLVVSGLNHMAARNCPENAWLLKQMIDTVTVPTQAWDAKKLEWEASVPPGTFFGFQKIEAVPEKTAWYSYQRDRVLTYCCRQTVKGATMRWRTQAVSKAESEGKTERTFVLSGGLGFSSEPKTDGFLLKIGGQEVLKFDVLEIDETTQEYLWKSADGKIQLRFEILRKMKYDQFGRFWLTVPAEMVPSDGALTLEVVSCGEGSRRWFNICHEWRLGKP